MNNYGKTCFFKLRFYRYKNISSYSLVFSMEFYKVTLI